VGDRYPMDHCDKDTFHGLPDMPSISHLARHTNGPRLDGVEPTEEMTH
jgi:hypothetical protein